MIALLLSFVLLVGTSAVQSWTNRHLTRATRLAVEAGCGAVPRCRKYSRMVVGFGIAYAAFVGFMLITGRRALLERIVGPFCLVPCIILSLGAILDARANLKTLRRRSGGG
jgi:hypothetical protein